MRYVKRWEHDYEHGYESGYVSIDVSPRMLRTVRGWDQESRELWVRAAAWFQGNQVLRREMLFGGLRVIRGGRRD
jgi:hypothetical protein